MLKGQQVTRRHFLGTTAGTMGAVMAVPFLIPKLLLEPTIEY